MDQYQLNQILTSGHYEYIKEQLEEALALMGVGHTQLAPVLRKDKEKCLLLQFD